MSTRPLKKTYDVVIIGGGVIGNSCALELARGGRRTLSIDQNTNAGYGSTSSSSSIVRVFYSALDSCKLAWEGYHGWLHWADYIQAPAGEQLASFRSTGGLILQGPEKDIYMQRVENAMKKLNIDHEVWDRAELERRLPYFSTDSYFPPKRLDDETFGEVTGEMTGGLYTKHTGYMDDPQLAARNLADAAQRSGAEFLWRKEVTSLTFNGAGNAVTGVVLDDGTGVEAPIIINAAGPHSSVLHKMAFHGAQVPDDSTVTSKPFRVEVAVIPAPPGTNLDETMPWIADNDLGIYYRPQFPDQFLVGGTEPECDPKHFLDHPSEMNANLSEEWTTNVYRAGLRLKSLPIPNSARGLVAMYDASDDWMPIYDKSSLGGWYNARGTSGNQFKNAPVVGQLMKGIIEAVEGGQDHDANVVKLDLQHTGEELNTGVFSRLRNAQGSETSGRVLG